MDYSDGDYQAKLGELQQGLLTFLQSFEREQEDIGVESVRASQQRLEKCVGDFFAITTKTFFSQIPDAGLHDFNDALARALSYFGDAYETFINAGGETFNHSFLQRAGAFVSLATGVASARKLVVYRDCFRVKK